MGSESDEVLVDDSDDSLLDAKESNGLVYDVPLDGLPSLESVLWDMEFEEGSDTSSLHSQQSMSTKFRSMLYHCVLQGLSSQLSSADERVGAGLPTVITNSLKYVAVGTSHGYIFAFDSEQKLCWCCHDVSVNDQGAVSALAFNLDSTRLLVGYERGFISMVDASNGDVVRKLPDAHAPQTAVLHLRFTFLNNMALCGDSSGCVFSLGFGRRLGVRNWDSKCLFSGARGEVCIFEPLTQGYDLQFLSHNVLVAMATLSKVIVITVSPRLKVIFSQQLPRISTYLPLISWQMVSVGRTFQPVLAWGRGNELHYSRVYTHGTNNKKIRLLPLRSVQLPYNLTALHWLGSRHLALLDASENLHLCDVRSQRELEVLELASAGLVYSSAHFKALAVGGGVSEAFALAGERACYNSLSCRGNQLLVLGNRAVHMIKLRSWPERLVYLSEQGRWTEALNLAADEGTDRDKITSSLLLKYLENLNQNTVDKDSLTAAVNCCVKLDRIDILCNELWEAVSIDEDNQDWYYTLLTNHITNDVLTRLSPAVTQNLVAYLELRDLQVLEKVLLSLEVTCLDLHQVLSICRKRKLYNAWIHITTKTMGDYCSPLTEFLAELTPDNHKLGNTMLVYVSSCLSGLGYPTGFIPERDISRVKHDVLRCLETVHSITGDENEPSYPYLRALVKYNTRECLNLVELAFREVEFSGEMGLLQRQRLVKILIDVVVAPEFSDNQTIMLACFISRLVMTQNLNLEEATFKSVVESLTTVTDDPLSLRDHMEREQVWLDLLNANKLGQYGRSELLEKALESKCFRIAEYLYELENDYSNILSCYLDDPVRKSGIFTYIRNFIDVEERCIKEQFLVYFKQLVAVDGKGTCDIVIEHFLDIIENLVEIIGDDDDQLQYTFLSELVGSEIKLPCRIAEKYLDLLCRRNEDNVCSYLQLSSCRTEEALKITRKYSLPEATALLLEQGGEWSEALRLLIENRLIDRAVGLCIRGVEHLDSGTSQQLWLTLLQSKANGENASLRQLLYAAAPHVPPAELLELVSNVNFGDVKSLLQGMLSDYSHDISMLTTTLDLLSKDLHQGLARSLFVNGRAVGASDVNCDICHKQLHISRDFSCDHTVAVWFCGHTYHSSCLKGTDHGDTCPQCRTSAAVVPRKPKTGAGAGAGRHATERRNTSKLRPDLEGHF